MKHPIHANNNTPTPGYVADLAMDLLALSDSNKPLSDDDRDKMRNAAAWLVLLMSDRNRRIREAKKP